MHVQPLFFKDAKALRGWLRRNHQTAKELWVGYYKKGSGRPSVTYPESVDEALCFGWIDGIRKSIDADTYMNRFTPRRPGSVWSAVNTRRAQALIEEGRMQRAGRMAFEARDPAKTLRQSERPALELSARFEAELRTHKAAWAFWQAQTERYRSLASGFVMGARREDTQIRRFSALLACSAAGRRLDPMNPFKGLT